MYQKNLKKMEEENIGEDKTKPIRMFDWLERENPFENQIYLKIVTTKKSGVDLG